MSNPDLPMLNVEAFVPAIVTAPFVVPVPASIVTPPPVEEVPPSFPPVRNNVPPLAELVLFTKGWIVRFDPPARVVRAGVDPPSTEIIPVSVILSFAVPPD